ncbi:MAG: biotin--[acetyl-CoA-carboxylase] ligase [Deltaproteobacteria bacterium]|nr:biotin--[acetyl-CoA-carboxylase] ligase [Deltaproteobacteria bacterium]
MDTREKLIALLRGDPGRWISGESLTKDLGVSRAAICKQVKGLRKQGYDIASSTRKGYLFRGTTERLLPREIVAGLDTRVFGKQQIHYFDAVDSTNLRAKALASEGACEGTLVVAERQTLGRGRRTRKWFSPEGDGIYLSLILRPCIAATEAAGITLMTAVAAADALERLAGLPVRIKWPNDILVRRKKLCGILTEIATEMDTIDYVVIGVGVNVNTPESRFPEELRDRATSMSIESGRRYSRVAVVRAFLEAFEKVYQQFIAGGFDGILSRWKELTDVIGQQVRVVLVGRVIIGRVLDVDRDGTLLVTDGYGRVHRVLSGDLVMLRPEDL